MVFIFGSREVHLISVSIAATIGADLPIDGLRKYDYGYWRRHK